MDVLKIGDEEDTSHKMREESSDDVRICRPLGGGKIPHVAGRVCDERTVRVFPEGTGSSDTASQLETHIAKARWRSLHIRQRAPVLSDAK